MKRITLALMALLALSFSLKAQQYVSTEPANRNVILEEFTGRGCGYCTDGHRIANELMANNPGRLWAINIHAGGYAQTSYPNMITQDGNTIHGGFQISGYPTGVVNRTTAAGQSRSAWAGIASQQLNQTSECNVAGMAIVNPQTRLATITVEVYYTGNSTVDQNFLTVAMLQDSILGSQADYGNYNPTQWLNGQYVHMHILRDVISESAWGDPISPTTQGTLITRTYEYEIPEVIGSPNGVDVDIDNIFFLAWVSERQQGNAYRPILTGCHLDMVQGSDEPIYPMIRSVSQVGGATCTHTKIVDVNVQNGGTDVLTSLTINAEVEGETYTINWEGNLAQYEIEKLEIPVEVSFGTHPINVEITEANGQPYSTQVTSSVNCLEWQSVEIEGEEEELKLELMQDKFGNHITWEFTTPDGTVLASGGPYTMLASGTGTQLHIEHATVPANECVKFTIYDQMENGICCSFGHGYYIVKDSQGNVLFGDEDDGEFGAEATHLISVGVYNEFQNILGFTDDLEMSSIYMVKAYAVVNGQTYYGPETTFQTWMENVDEFENSLKLYPNPTANVLNVEGEGMRSIEVYNAVGQCLMKQEINGNKAQVNTESLNNGMYFIRVIANDGAMLNRTFSVAR